MDVEGAALATVISQGISFLIFLCYLWKKQDRMSFEFKIRNFWLDKEIISVIIRVSVPMEVYSLATGSYALLDGVAAVQESLR